MDLLLFVVLGAAVVVYFIAKANRPAERGSHQEIQALPKRAPTPPDVLAAAKAVLASAAMPIYRANEPWLTARWQAASTARRAGIASPDFPDWYFDPITDRQRNRLLEDGFELDLGTLSKGNASDLIGLLMPPEPEDESVLRFFKSSPLLLNQTRARHEAKRLLADPDCLARWSEQPAHAAQREVLRSYDVKVPKQLSATDADAFIQKTEKELAASNPELLARAQAMMSIMNEINDPETRQSYGFKKPPIGVVRDAIRALEEEGRTLDDLAGDIYSVAEKIIELRPDLMRIS
jgi:hypothetical protein